MRILIALLFLSFTCTVADAGWRSRNSCTSSTCTSSGQYVACSTCPGGVAFVPDVVPASGPVTFKTVNGVIYKCTGSACEVVSKNDFPALKDGERVDYPASPTGLFQAGTGTIEKSYPLNSGRGKVYTVKTDKGKILPVAFEDGELWAH